MTDAPNNDHKYFWEQMPGEPDQAYRPFCKYRDYGPDRSMDKVYWQGLPDDDPKRKHRHPSQWDEYSRRWQWVPRAAAYDSHLEMMARQAREQALTRTEGDDWAGRRKVQAEQAYNMGKALLDKGAEMLQFPLATIQQEARKELEDGKTVIHQVTTVYPGKWTMRDAAALIKTGIEAMQFATGGVAEAEAGGGAGDAVTREAQPLMIAFTQALEIADEDTRDLMLQTWERMMAEARQLEDLINTTQASRLPGVTPVADFYPDDDDA